MHWKLAIGLLLTSLLGCGDYDTELRAPDSATYGDLSLAMSVGETHRLEAYEMRWGGAGGSQSFDCGDDGAITSSDPGILEIGTPLTRIELETQTADTVDAILALAHAKAPGTATITAICDGMTTTQKVVVK